MKNVEIVSGMTNRRFSRTSRETYGRRIASLVSNLPSDSCIFSDNERVRRPCPSQKRPKFSFWSCGVKYFEREQSTGQTRKGEILEQVCFPLAKASAYRIRYYFSHCFRLTYSSMLDGPLGLNISRNCIFGPFPR